MNFLLHLLKTFLKSFETLKDLLTILKDLLPNLTFSKCAHYSSLLKMWNNMPLDLKRSNSLSIFKNRLLNSLLENYIAMCYKPNCYSCKTN